MERSIEDKITETFLALTRSGKAKVMARVANRETVAGRAAYLHWDDPVDDQLLRQSNEGLRRSNESLHYITNYIVAVLEGRAGPDYDASFMKVTIEVMAQRHRHELEWLAAYCLACSEVAAHGPQREAGPEMR